jgi:hypothetical protein
MKQPIEVGKLHDIKEYIKVANELGGYIYCDPNPTPNEWAAGYKEEEVGRFPIAYDKKFRVSENGSVDFNQSERSASIGRQNVEKVHTLLFLVAQKAGHRVDLVNELIYPKEEE